MIRSAFFITSFIMFYLTSTAQPAVDTNFHLYLLAGQSNMAGRGEISAKFAAEGAPSLLMLNKNNEWVQAKHPLHFDKPKVAGVGPGMAFGLAMAEGSKGVLIGLVPCAVGGSSIDLWKPGAYDSATKTHPYDDAIKRVAIAMKHGVFKGVIWHQGESDSDPKKAAVYLPKLITLIKSLREVTQDPGLPFVAGELGSYKEIYDNINRGLKGLPDAVPHTAVATSLGLIHKGDLTHFDSFSAETLGKRYAKEMKVLQGK